MGWFSKVFSTPIDNILGFNPQNVGISAALATPGGEAAVSAAVGAAIGAGSVIAPGATTIPKAATTDPATNTPTPPPAGTSFDQVQSYLNAKAQQAYIEQQKAFIEQLRYRPSAIPSTFLQTQEGQNMIKFGGIAALLWLFLG